MRVHILSDAFTPSGAMPAFIDLTPVNRCTAGWGRAERADKRTKTERTFSPDCILIYRLKRGGEASNKRLYVLTRIEVGSCLPPTSSPFSDPTSHDFDGQCQ
jgi:hypothetical protein